jgi:hypothetical protein
MMTALNRARTKLQELELARENICERPSVFILQYVSYRRTCGHEFRRRMVLESGTSGRVAIGTGWYSSLFVSPLES